MKSQIEVVVLVATIVLLAGLICLSAVWLTRRFRGRRHAQAERPEQSLLDVIGRHNG